LVLTRDAVSASPGPNWKRESECREVRVSSLLTFSAGLSLAQASVILVAVMLWVACALKAAGIAHNNDGNYQLWAAVGLLTGPVGLAASYFYFRATGERHRTARYSVDGRSDLPQMTSCPKCGQSVPKIYENCQFCGQPLGKKR